MRRSKLFRLFAYPHGRIELFARIRTGPDCPARKVFRCQTRPLQVPITATKIAELHRVRMGRLRPAMKSGPVCRRTAPSQLRNLALSAGRACFNPIEELSYSRKHRYPFQRSRPPRRRPRYPSLDPLPLSAYLAGFPRAISSLGAAIQLSARFAISEREYPASSRSDFLECSASAQA